jgi:hypothetical protein
VNTASSLITVKNAHALTSILNTNDGEIEASKDRRHNVVSRSGITGWQGERSLRSLVGVS